MIKKIPKILIYSGFLGATISLWQDLLYFWRYPDKFIRIYEPNRWWSSIELIFFGFCIIGGFWLIIKYIFKG